MKYFADKVVYQIYPKSFYDSNNDGFGDLNGICEKLDYLKELGVDYLWLNPIFVSPQNDGGYDISNYYEIDPLFGSMEDLENLIQEAKKRDIYLMFDMVFNHTSTEHEWFQKALLGDEKYKKYYFFKKAKKDGSLPTNWESKFGGSCWEYVKEFDEYYLHLFDKTQADLNWKNPDVRQELIKILNFWIKKGIKGFRFDVINLIDKVSFEDDYDGVGKKFYTDGELVHKYLNELNEQTFGNDDVIITVGEMSSTTIDNCIGYTKPQNNELNMTFNFHHLKVDYKNQEKWTIMPFDFLALKKLFNDWQIGMQKGDGWNALFWNCHDQPRSVSRFGNDKKYHDKSAKMLATAIHFQRGTPYIYQGEEIGITNAYFTNINQYQDVESINYFNILKNQGNNEKNIYEILQNKSRDNARTPMQWNSSGGFSNVKSWIEMNPLCKEINVENNLKNENSIFKYYQQLIKLRKKYQVISLGDYYPLLENDTKVFAFIRKFNQENLIVFNNFYEDETIIDLTNYLDYEILLSNYNIESIDEKYILKPYESLVLYKNKQN